MELPEGVRGKLLAIAQPVRTAANVVLFRQGDGHVDGYYVIVKGTVKIEQKMAQYKSKVDMPPVVIRTCYDGDRFGEVCHFQKDIKSFAGYDIQEQFDVHNKESVFEERLNMTKEMAEDLTEEEVRKLNKQQTTATTMEACDLLYINRVESMKVLLGGMQDSVLVERLSFLNKIDLFKGINRNHLLPLVSNLIIKRYRKS